MAIQKIQKEDIDFNKVYGTRADAENRQNNVKVNEVYWGDNGDLFYDDETGMVSENGVGLGFINKDSLLTSEASSDSIYNGSYRNDSNIMQRSSIDTTNPTENKNSSNEIVSNDISSIENSNNINTNIFDSSQEDNILNNDFNITSNEEEEKTYVEFENTNEEATIKPIEDTVTDNSLNEKTIDDSQKLESNNDNVFEPTIEEEITSNEEMPNSYTEQSNSEDIAPITSFEEEKDYTIGVNPSGVEYGRNIDEINDKVDEFGGNNGHSIYDDAQRSGNEEIYKKNMNNLLDSLEGVEKQFLDDGKGYSFQSTVFSGGKHATNQDNPTHLMGSKADLRFYKDGVQLDVNNSSQEDWDYIKDVLTKNNLGVQFEKQNTVWGDVFLEEALNKSGETVSYDNGWGSGSDIHYT